MNFREQKHRALYGPICNFGGGSSSDSKTSTQSSDQRFTNGSGVAASASAGGTNILTVNQLDGGAISDAFGLGHDALNAVATIGTASNSAVAHTAELAISGVLNSEQGTQAAYAQATQAAADAYKNATTQVAAAYQDSKTSNEKTIVIGALVVVGLVVLAPALKRGAL